MAGISAVYQAILSRWSSEELDELIPGGLWYAMAEPGVDWPYAVFVSAGNPDGNLTTDTEFRDHLIQLSIYVKSNGATDPVLAAGSLLDSVVSSLFQAPLSISGSGKVLNVRRTREDIRRDETERDVWVAEADFKIRRSQSYDPSPG